ncbi:MAG TPA: Uma2 family endonuclease [Anaerolineales bacterium]|nr:Uma2 family endonuclease [Anaerolineales bacterium]
MAERVAVPPTVTEDKWTYDRYLRETADGEYFTIIAGEKIMSPSPTVFHQHILLNLGALLQAWARQSQKGRIGVAPLDLVLAEGDVVQPDLIFVLNEHAEGWKEKNFRDAPDLVVEILSPGSVKLDREKKRALYARYGIPEFWIVSPGERTVEVLRLQGQPYETAVLLDEDDRLESPRLAGFTCAVKDLFIE